MSDLDTLRPEVRECAATPRDQLIRELMDPNIPKSEHCWAARREIETLRERAERAEDELDALKNLQSELAAQVVRAEKAEAELAALKARIAEEPGSLDELRIERGGGNHG